MIPAFGRFLCSVDTKSAVGIEIIMDRQPVNTFSFHYRRIYGKPVGKIPLDTGMICPNREHGGCIYCRQDSFAPSYLQQKDSIAVQLEKGKRFLLRDRFRLYFGYFQQESPTAMDIADLRPLLEQVLGDYHCVGVIVAARPDNLEQDVLAGLAELAERVGKECILEIGLQSFHDRSLRLLNRHHDVQDFIDTVARIKDLHILKTGVHLILGIPGETEDDMLVTLRQVCDLGVDALKLHHLQVIRDTPLHAMYRRGQIPVFSAAGYLDLLARLLPEIPEHIVIHRLWSHSHPDLLIAPRWDMLAGNLSNLLRETMSRRGVYQGKYAD